MSSDDTLARTTQRTSPGDDQPRRRSALVVLPVAMFLGLAFMFAFALFSGDPSKLPSPLIGRTVPQVDFLPLEGLKNAGRPVPGVTASTLADGNVHIVNFWASWCTSCVQEHPMLIDLQKRLGVSIVGVNYKDSAEDARRFIERHGNPYSAVGMDPSGRGGIEWGVYGMPESFVVDGKGRIVYKYPGPISSVILQEKIIPAIEKARKEQAAAAAPVPAAQTR